MTIAANMFMCVNNTVDTVDLTKTWFEDTSYLGQYSNCWTCLVVQPFWKVVFSICLLICLFFTATTNEVWGVFMFELRLCCFPSNCCVIYMVDMCWYSKLWLMWENDTSITLYIYIYIIVFVLVCDLRFEIICASRVIPPTVSLRPACLRSRNLNLEMSWPGLIGIEQRQLAIVLCIYIYICIYIYMYRIIYVCMVL